MQDIWKKKGLYVICLSQPKTDEQLDNLEEHEAYILPFHGRYHREDQHLYAYEIKPI